MDSMIPVCIVARRKRTANNYTISASKLRWPDVILIFRVHVALASEI